MPVTVTATVCPVGVRTRRVSPTVTLLSLAQFFCATACPGRRERNVALEPSFHCASYSEVKVEGSTPLTCTRLVPILPWPMRTTDTVCTPGTLATAWAACGANPPKPLVACMTACAREPPLMASLIVVLALAAKIDAKQTSATPTISAAAVTAVREGSRTVFSRARRPVTP